MIKNEQSARIQRSPASIEQPYPGAESVRSALLLAMASYGQPMTRDQLHETSAARELSASRPAIFQALRSLLRERLVRCVYGADMSPRYAPTALNSGQPAQSQPRQHVPAAHAVNQPQTTQSIDRRSVLRADLLSMDIQYLDLSVRATNCLRAIGVSQIRQLVEMTQEDLMQTRNMGKTTLAVIEQALENVGLTLRMSGAQQPKELDTFLDVIIRLRQQEIKTARQLSDMSEEELLSLPGVTSEVLDLLNDGLTRWGLHLGMRTVQIQENDASTKSGSSPHNESGDPLFDLASATNFREELLHVVKQFLSSPNSSKELACFLAHHGIEGGPCTTLQEIADNAEAYGFSKPVTRERVRQILARGELKFRYNESHIDFSRWAAAVDSMRKDSITSVNDFVIRFGYGDRSAAERRYKMLKHCSEVFRLDFPFELCRLAGLSTLVFVDGSEPVVKNISRIPEALDGPYFEISNVARTLNVDRKLIERLIDASPRLEIIDSEQLYFWKRPELPPVDYGKTGNGVLTGLCKVFSVTDRAQTTDLSQSLGRTRALRKRNHEGPIPATVVEGIARRSELFEVHEDEIVKKEGLEWCTIGRRDLGLLSAAVAVGKVVSSTDLYSRLSSIGFSQENANQIVVHSPFLVHSLSGRWSDQGIYKLVLNPGDIDVNALAHHVGRESLGSDSGDLNHTPARCVDIVVSPRTAVSGKYFGLKDTDLQGEWDVRDSEGEFLGRVSIANRGVSGLAPLIQALGLKKDDLLRLSRRGEDPFLLARA